MARSDDDERLCSNCREPLAPKATECAACGVYAGDLYDERVHRPKTRVALFGTLLLAGLMAAGAAIWWNERGALPERTGTAAEPPPVRVVGDRPGGARRSKSSKVNEAEAILLVRRHLVATMGIKTDCVALLGHGFTRGGYVVTARDTCSNTRLGRWRVDGRSGDVGRAR